MCIQVLVEEKMLTFLSVVMLSVTMSYHTLYWQIGEFIYIYIYIFNIYYIYTHT